ncbi:MAG: tetratricopeptide repeat protein [Chloroflexaceae bacterium]|nr:tetratricopeptide repeat protein [Chloroflexaceae bacterium]
MEHKLPPWLRLQHLADRDPRRAAHLAQRALEQISPDHPAYAWAACAYGYAAMRWERSDIAYQWLETACTLLAAQGHTMAVLHCRRALVMSTLLTPYHPIQHATIPDRLDGLIEVYNAAEHPLEAARTSIQRIWFLNMQGDPRDALATAEAIEHIIMQQGTPYDQGWLLRLRAHACTRLGQTELARRLLAQSIERFTQVRSPLELAKCWTVAADIDQRSQHYEQALENLDRARAIFQRLALPRRVVLCDVERGSVLGELGQLGSALTTTQHVLTMAEQFHMQFQVAISDMHLGNIAYHARLNDLALAAYRRAQRRFETINQPYYSLICGRNEALVLREEQQHAVALDLLVALAAEAQRLGDAIEAAENIFLRGQICSDMGQYDEACTYLQEAYRRFSVLDHPVQAGECLLEQGWLMLRHTRHPNLAAAQHALATAYTILAERPAYQWRAAFGLGYCAELQGHHAAALAQYLTASRTVATLRVSLASEHASSNIFRQATELYQHALRLAVRLGHLDMVLNLAEQQRAVALYVQRDRPALHIPPHLQATYEQQRTHLRSLIGADRTGTAFADALTAYLDTLLRVRHSATLDVAQPAPQLAIAALRARLSTAHPEGWMVLTYVDTGDRYPAATP